MKRSIQLLTLIVLLVSSTLFSQNVIHVPGDYPNIQTGILFAQDGDTVLVAPGTYSGDGNQQIELLGKSIVLMSTNGPTETTIMGDGTGDGFWIHDDENSDTEIIGFTVANFALGFDIWQAGPTIRSCIVDGTTSNNGMSIQVWFTHPVIENCIVQNTSNNGFFLKTTNSTSITLINCKSINNEGRGIYWQQSSSNTNVYLKNCTVSGNTTSQDGGGVFHTSSSGFNGRLSVSNSIIYGNNSSSSVFKDVFSLNAEINYSNIGGSGWPGTGNINADPEFVDPDNNNFRLKSTSPCIDSGDNSVIDFPTDLDGLLRIWDGDGDGTSTVDMGAYEFDAPAYQPLGIQSQPTNVAVCEGNEATFNVSATGILLTYQWFHHGEEIMGATASTLVLSNVTPADEGSYSCVVSDFSGMTASSQSANLNVSAQVEVSIEIEANEVVCEDVEVTFSAVTQNEGINPSYQWQVDGQNVGSDSPTFTTNTLNNGSNVTCILTSSEECVLSNPVTSNTLTAKPKPTPSLDSNSPICAENELQITGMGGISYEWSGPAGFNSNEQNPTIPNVQSINAGTYSVVVTGENGCTENDQIEIEVLSLPDVSLDLPFMEVCNTFEQIPLTGGTPAGGIYSGPGVIGNSSIGYFLIPQSAGAGTHDITYSYVDLDSGCENSAAFTITVNELPNVGLPDLGIHCENDGSFILSGGSPAGGVYSGTGVMNGLFEPSLAGVGVHEITYTYENQMTGCENSATANVTVLPAANVSVEIEANASEICHGDNVTFTAASQNGGSTPIFDWYVDGELKNSGSPIWITSELENGQTVTCVLTSSDDCVVASSVTSNELSITVYDLPDPAPSVTSPVCEGETISFSAASGLEYEWSGPNGFSSNEQDPEITNASLSDAGTYSIVATNQEGCVGNGQVEVVVNEVPDVSLDFSGLNPINWKLDSIELTGGSPAGGTYSGPGVSNGWFFPTSVGIGSYEVIYSFTNSEGCSDTDMAMIEVITSTKNIDTGTTLNIFPNPSNGVVTINLFEPSLSGEILDLTITNIHGQVIHSEVWDSKSSTMTLDLRGVSQGSYLLKLRGESFINVERLLIH